MGTSPPANTVFDASPSLCPIIEDELADTVTALSLTRRDFEIISFLDQRLLNQSYPRQRIYWVEIENFKPNEPTATDYIFHIGHVGSTLLSRLLGLSPTVFSIREPAVLRRLAVLHGECAAGKGSLSLSRWGRRLGGLLRLWSRTWAPDQRTLLKATSSVSEIAAPLLDRSPDAKAILLTLPPEAYIATILGGPASRVELEQMAPIRLSRLQRRLGDTFGAEGPLSEGERAAMSWACEMAGLAEAAAAHPGACLWLDFETLLAAPASTLARALTHLRGAAPAEVVGAMAASPYLTRYSKAPEYGYDANLRRKILDQARAEHADELRKGLAWLERTAAQQPAVAALIARSV